MSTPPSNVVAVLMRKKDILHILKEMKWALFQKTSILKWSVLLNALVEFYNDKRANKLCRIKLKSTDWKHFNLLEYYQMKCLKQIKVKFSST